MKSRWLFAALAICTVGAAFGMGSGTGPEVAPPVPDRPTRGAHTTEPPAAQLEVGDAAPDFSYLAPEGNWRKGRELLDHGPVLLVFGGSDADLKALEQARPQFLSIGVVPAAVVDLRPSSAAALSRRLRLGYPIVSDPMRAIAKLFNSLDPPSLTAAPSYFVVGADRVIMGLGHGRLPATDKLLALTARSLGRPLPQSTRSVVSP